MDVIRAAVVLLLLNAPASADMRMALTPTKLHLSFEPGARQTATVEVSNTGDDAIRVITYVVDWTTPREGGMRPATIRSRVVFPHPLSPRIETNSPSAISRLMLRRASREPPAAWKLLETSSNRIFGAEPPPTA